VVPVTRADRAIRYSTVAAVTAVALVAAFVSYRHALQVVRAHGESGPLALAYPATIDGLIYAASMVLLDAARRGTRAHPLAWCGLVLGIGATLAANVAAGLASGPVGALIGAWPAVALVLAYELLMVLIRSAGAAVPESVPGPVPVPEDVPEALPAPRFPIGLQLAGAVSPWPGVPEADPAVPAVPEPPAGLNGHGHQAAELFAAELAAGDVPSIRAIRSGLRVGQDKARQVQAYLETLTPAGRSIARLRAEMRQDAALASPL
jgi:Protein of unknown function (DUF2637)